jgi:hypothetical protein
MKIITKFIKIVFSVFVGLFMLVTVLGVIGAATSEPIKSEARVKTEAVTPSVPEPAPIPIKRATLPLTAMEIARHNSNELSKLAKAMAVGREYECQFAEDPYPLISKWNKEEIDVAVTYLKGETALDEMILANLQREFDKQIYKKDKKKSYLWALNYIEGVTKRAAKYGADSINMNPKAIRRDVEKGADWHYPKNETMNRWFVRFVFEEIKSQTDSAKRIFEDHTLPEEALAEIRADRRDWRHTLNTSPEWN